MSQDLSDLDGILDNGDNPHFATALGTDKRIDLIHLREQTCPRSLACVNGHFFTVIQWRKAGIIAIGRWRWV